MRYVGLLWFLVAMVVFVGDAKAQLFGGTRRLGTPITRPAGSGNNAEVGAIRGNERFVRGNRRRTDFIGTDSQDEQTFVGTGTVVSGEVRSATEGFEIKTSEEANERLRSATQQRNVMYDPRLTVGFEFNPLSPEAMEERLQRRLASSPHFERLDRVSLSVEAETVTLAGEVATDHERTLIGLLLLLEPGISEVRNQLTVRPSSAPHPPAAESSSPADAGS